MSKQLTKLSQALIAAYDKDYKHSLDNTISVNPVVAELAAWYEKFRTAMDYRDDEVILRSAIERILKRRLMMSNTGVAIAAPLIRELVWARYFPDASVSESSVNKVAQAIDLYVKLEEEINKKHRINKMIVSEWIIHLLSSEIEDILKPSPEKNMMCNFIFNIFKSRVTILDDTDEIRDIQVFIAVRRAFAYDDLALLRFHLFRQYFGHLNAHNLDKISTDFMDGYKKIEEQFNYPSKDKIHSYIKDQMIPFLILDDVLRKYKGKLHSLISDEEQLNLAILEACSSRYKTIVGKVRRAIVRSVIFIFFTKAIFALFVEGAFERLLYGRIVWPSIALNTLTPPALMVLVGVFVKTPAKDNSFKISHKISTILFDENPNLEVPLQVKKRPSKIDPIIWILFMSLWFTTFVLSFGAIIFLLTKLEVNPLSQAVFIFFLAIVSFVGFRVNRTAHMYILKDKREYLGSILFDFFFMPFIQVGRRLTAYVSQINIILFVFDFIIEAPFKGIVAFLEQWLLFLRTQREKLD
ncbi:hypothetical protein HYS92_02385 [Candidatus Daviesbacteria bacterium]|nr:hypothetical protein [Candidatus Daviesbacteria bacterium]